MFDYYFTFRSITAAQRAQIALEKDGLYSLLLRAPRAMSSRGCGYALKVRGYDGQSAAAAFSIWKTPYTAVYRVYATGETEETTL